MNDSRLENALSEEEKYLFSVKGYEAEDIAKDPKAPCHVLRIMAMHESYRVRAWVAANPSCLEKCLVTLALYDDHMQVQANALENPRCPLWVLNSHPLTADLPKSQPIDL